MKRMIFMMMLMVMSIGVLTSCSKDDEQEGKGTLENSLRGRRWMLDDSEKGSLLFYRNHLVVYLEGKDNVRDAKGYMCGIGVGTWRDRNGVLNSAFTAEMNAGASLKQMLPNNLALVENNGGVLRMEDDGYKEHTLRLLNNFEDYTDETEHDKALTGTWTQGPALYHNLNTGEQYMLHPEMTISKDGTMRMVVPELNVDYTTTTTTKDGRVTFGMYDTTGFSSGERTMIYVREGDRLMLFTENGRSRLFQDDEWRRK